MLNKKWFYQKCSNLSIHKNIYIGFSGGLDSSVLLHLCKITFPFIKAIHINHLYNYNSYNWNIFCKKECDKLKIPIIICLNKKQYKKNASEEYFRILRYLFFSKIIITNSSLLLAHNKNDNVETSFLNFLRGSGINGLSGIHNISKIQKLNIIRPFLTIDKNEIMKYAIKNNISYIFDNSNINFKFKRNFIRYNLLCNLKKNWDNLNNNIHNLSLNNLYTYNITINKCKYFFKSKGISSNVIFTKYLKKLPKFWQYEIIRIWIKQFYFKTPSIEQLNEINKLILSKNQKISFIKFKNFHIKKYKDYIYIEKTTYKNTNYYLFLYKNKYSYNFTFTQFIYFLNKNKFKINITCMPKFKKFTILLKRKKILISGLWKNQNFNNNNLILKYIK